MKKIKLRGMTWIFALAVALAGAFMMMPKAVEAAEEDVVINETNFPDEVFRKYVGSNIDGNTGTDKDGVLSEEEIAAVTEIDVTNEEEGGISRLDGIEYFTNLERLYCGRNIIESLNLEKMCI